MSERLRISIVGKHELAVALFDTFSKNSQIALTAVTCKTEREDLPERGSLKRYLKENNFLPLNAGYSLEEFETCIHQCKPDLLFSAGYDRMIRPSALPKETTLLNIHYGMLPKYRGNFSIPHAILNDDSHVGVTLHKVSEGMDSGDIFLQERVLNDPKKSCLEIYHECRNHAVRMAAGFVESTFRGEKPQPREQNESEATYYSPEYPNGFKIPWRQTALYVSNYIRASYFPPLCPAFSIIDGGKVEFEFPVTYAFALLSERPGSIVKHGNRTGVTTWNGIVYPEKVRFEKQVYEFETFCEARQLVGEVFE